MLYKLLRKDKYSREDVVTVTSGIGIFINLATAAVKIFIGVLISSVAIISEGVHNASDSLAAVLAVLGTKLALKKPDKKHPFGYGRIEYLTSLIISAIIIYSGIELLIASFNLIFTPEETEFSYGIIVIITLSAIIKFIFGLFAMKEGKRIDSQSLYAVGAENRNDSYASAITVISGLVYLIFGLSLDAYAGVIISLIIIKVGLEILKDTLDELLGRSGKKELADKLYSEIRSHKEIINAADMMLHNYGPNAYSGSCNLEIDHKKTVGEVYDFLHRLQLDIMHKYKVTMVFGIYAVGNESEDLASLRSLISETANKNEHIIGYHALFKDDLLKKIYCDILVDYSLKDYSAVENNFKDTLKTVYPDYEVILTLETEYV